jgi:hypothetical protein
MLRRTLAASVAAITVLLGLPSIAASSASASAHAAHSVTVSGTTTGTSPVTGKRCTSTWKWKVGFGLSTGADYSEVEWTANSCGFVIQDRSRCEGIYNNTYDTFSGKVVATYLWDKAKCNAWVDAIHHGAKRYETATSWTSYVTYWSG